MCKHVWKAMQFILHEIFLHELQFNKIMKNAVWQI